MGNPRIKIAGAPKGSMGYVVQTERLGKGWTQKDLSARANVGQSRISQIENGNYKNTTDDVLLGLARALDLNAAAMRQGKVERGFAAGLLGTAAHHLDTKLNAINHDKWIAYGDGLLSAQMDMEEPQPDPQPGAGEQRAWRARRQPRRAS